MEQNEKTNGIRRRRVTAQDVAEAAGVSRSAVSRAFTEGAYIDGAKREKIHAIAEELGYKPNALAASLQGARSHLVAMFVGEMRNEYDKEVAAKMIAGLNAAGHWPIVIGGSGEAARDAVSRVLSYPLNALILRSGSLDSDIAEQCAKLGIPMISSGRLLDAPNVDNVCCNNAEGMLAATRHLVGQGRTRFCYIGGPEGFFSAPQRRQGLVQGLVENGLELVAERTGNYTAQSGHRMATELLTSGTRMDALICANDAMAIGALSALRENGVHVPNDVAVVGFDDIAMADWPAFRLTTVRNPMEPLVDVVIDLLEKRLADPSHPTETIFLATELVLRDTH